MAGRSVDCATEQGATLVRARPLVRHAGALEVFVHSPDRDGLFAAIVATLDRLGLAIQQARLFDGPADDVFDTFEVVPAEGQRNRAAAEVEQHLAAALATPDLDDIRPARRAQPRHLRHFRLAPQVAVRRPLAGERTLLSLVATDRPGLLADVTHVLRRQRLRVHDARIATFGDAPRTSSRSPTSATARSMTHDNNRRCAMHCSPASRESNRQ